MISWRRTLVAFTVTFVGARKVALLVGLVRLMIGGVRGTLGISSRSKLTSLLVLFA